MSRIIPLTRGKVTVVDHEDWHKLTAMGKWQFHNGYAKKGVFNGKNMTEVFMHRVIMDTPNGLETDHINQDRLDNRRVNLRIATKSQNLGNYGASKNNKLGVKGVIQVGKRFRAFLLSKHLGYFDTVEEASNAYEAAARKHFGEFASKKGIKRLA